MGFSGEVKVWGGVKKGGPVSSGLRGFGSVEGSGYLGNRGLRFGPKGSSGPRVQVLQV